MSEQRQGIRIKRNVFPADGVDVLLFQHPEGGTLQTARHIEWADAEAEVVSHNMTMSQADAEHLMRDLWEAGIRVQEAEEAKAKAEAEEARKAELERKSQEARKVADRHLEEAARKAEQDRKAHMDDLRNVAMGLIKCLQPKQP
jgi:paraquat-inducible protein B